MRVRTVLLGTAVAAATILPSVASAGAPLYPDIVEALPAQIQIQKAQQREMLRFTTVHLNLGPGNLQIRGGGQVEPCDIDGIHYDQCTHATQEILDASGGVVLTHDAGTALFHPEHNHWHQGSVALFDLRTDLTDPGSALANGVKITFCFVDVVYFGPAGDKKTYPRTYWECNGDFQGLAANWGDSYHQSTPLQELDITGVPDGVYYLTHTADPDNHWLEANEANNFAWVKLRLYTQGGNRKLEILGDSGCIEEPAICNVGGNP